MLSTLLEAGDASPDRTSWEASAALMFEPRTAAAAGGAAQ